MSGIKLPKKRRNKRNSNNKHLIKGVSTLINLERPEDLMPLTEVGLLPKSRGNKRLNLSGTNLLLQVPVES